MSKEFSLCGFAGSNTGEILCDVSRGITKRIAVFGGTILEADYATSAAVEAALKAASLKKRTDGTKLFMMPVIEDIADATEANREGTLNQGFKTILAEGKPAYTFKMFAGSTLAKSLRKWNNQTVRVVEFDANQRMWGTAKNADVIGYKAKLFFGGSKSPTGQNVEEGVVNCTLSILDTFEYFDNFAYIDLSGVNMNNVSTLLDATLSQVTSVANVHTITAKIKTARAGGDLYVHDNYATELADAAAWEAFTGTNFQTPLTITGVTSDAPNKGWDITFDATAYGNLSAGAKIKINLKDPATLDGINVSNLEGVEVVVTKSA